MQGPADNCRALFLRGIELIGELVAGRGRGTQPLTLPRAAAGAVIVMVVVHFHVATVATVVGAAGATGELCFLVPFNNFLDVLLIHDFVSFVNVVCSLQLV